MPPSETTTGQAEHIELRCPPRTRQHTEVPNIERHAVDGKQVVAFFDVDPRSAERCLEFGLPALSTEARAQASLLGKPEQMEIIAARFAGRDPKFNA